MAVVNAQPTPLPSPRIKDLHGCRFGRLTVVSFAGCNARGKACWLCQCACGQTSVVIGERLTRRQRSCGCLHRELTASFGDRTRRHGHAARRFPTQTAEYRAWQNLKNRCSNPRLKEWRYYGGRGIRVCERWQRSFSAFLADVGPKPAPDLQIDRIDNDGHYEPGNVRWTTRSEQVRNSRRCLRNPNLK
jgi:hypothetical protein